MTDTAIDIEHLRNWVGRTQSAEQVLDPFPARAIAGLLDHDTVPQSGDALPLPWHWLYFLETPRRSAIGADGHPALGGFLPPVPLPRRMWAAGSMRRSTDLIIGEPATKTSTVKAIDAKSGRTGTLVFVTVAHVLSQRGRTCIEETQHLVYRAAAVAAAPLPAGEPAPAGAEWAVQLVPDSPLLFRYSALTYNGHRIHYDAEYARAVEFYPGLVVHGPLLATLLLDAFGRHHPAAHVAGFDFRAVRPAFVDRPVAFAGLREGNRARLWTVDADAAVGMHASVEIAG